MKKFLSIFFPILFYLAAFIAIFLLKAQFTSSVWEGYRVLAVPAHIGEDRVLQKLKNHGINSVLSLSLQDGVYTNPMCPVTDFGQNYAGAVKSFYFDFDRAHQIYYIEENADLSAKISALFKDDVSGWKIERISTFSRLILILPALLSLAFFIASKRKLMFLLMQAPFMFFCVCSPSFVPCFCASVFSILAYTIQFYWKKPGWLNFLLKDLLCQFLLVCVLSFSIAAVFYGGGIKIAAGGIFSVIAGFLIFFALHAIDKSKKNAGFIFINSAQVCSFSLRRRLEFTGLVIFSAIVLSLAFIANSRFFSTGGLSGLTIPVPEEYIKSKDFSFNSYQLLASSETSQRKLPDLCSYIDLRWQTDTFPYVPLYANIEGPFAGNEVCVPAFNYQDKSGRVTTERKIMYTFDEAYYNKILDELALGKINGAEHLLFAQRHFVTVNYKYFH